MEEWGDLDPVQGSVTLDGSGNGALRFAPAGTKWRIDNISVQVSTAVSEATATVYKKFVGMPYRHSGTYAGSSGDNNQLEQPILLTDGEPLWIVWEGGDAGAQATAVLVGKRTVPADRGFRSNGLY
jgi:hypothetical protein